MIRMKFSQVTVGDVVAGDYGHTIEVKYIRHDDDGRIILREQMTYRWDGRLSGWPNDYIEIVNRCEVCRQRTLAHTGECMAPACQNISEVPEDPEAQLEWVKAARAFKAAAQKMSDLWPDLDERAQSVETPDEYPWNDSFDNGPLDGINAWLNEEKLNIIEQRANFMGDCPECGGQMMRISPPTEVAVLRATDVKRGDWPAPSTALFSMWVATCEQCSARLIE